MQRVIAFDVRGTPAPKGSSQAFAFKRPNGTVGARVVPGGSKGTRERMIGWDGAVRDAAAAAIGIVTSPPFVKVAVRVDIEFRIRRPAGHYGAGKNAGVLKASADPYPIGKPDRDKLERATLDALTGIVFDDDSRVVAGETTKVWALPGDEGARIRIAPVAADAPNWRSLLLRDADVSIRVELEADASVELKPPPILRLVPPAPTAQERIRKLITGTTFAAESAAMRRPKAGTDAEFAEEQRAAAGPALTVENIERAEDLFRELEDDFGGLDLV